MVVCHPVPQRHPRGQGVGDQNGTMQETHQICHFRHHKLTKNSTGEDLAKAVMGPYSPHLVPPTLLHIMYAYQYKVESLQGYRCTRDHEGDSIKEWVIQWRPIAVFTQHAPSTVTLPSELLQVAKAEVDQEDPR